MSGGDRALRPLPPRGIAVAHLDQELRVCRCNRAWADRIGARGTGEAGLVGRSLLELVPGLAPGVASSIVQLADGGTFRLQDVAGADLAERALQDHVLIPLVVEGRLEGFISLVLDGEERAADAARASRQREALERLVVSYRRELSALRDVMSVTSESLELRDVLRRVLDHVLRMMKSKVGAIHLLDEERTTLQLAASRGVPPDALEELDAPPGALDGGSWLAGADASSTTPEVAERLQSALPGSSARAPLPAIVVPLQSRGQSLGLISVLGRAGRGFDDDDIALLTSIADQVGVVVENARLYRQAEQLAVVRERERLARELHDSVTQSLYSLTLLAEASQRLLGRDDLERAGEYTERLGAIAQQALKEMRLLVYQLRPLVLKREGLAGALQQRLDAVEKRAGVDARLLVEGPIALPAPIEEGLYRIAQEALNNALKHAAPRSVVLRIHGGEGRVVLQVEDDGRGFDPAAVRDQGGMGLMNMRDRAERLGGSFSLVSAPGQGTTVRVDVEVP